MTTGIAARRLQTQRLTGLADLLAKLGRTAEASVEFKRAASLTENVRERKLLLDRAAASALGAKPPPEA